MGHLQHRLTNEHVYFTFKLIISAIFCLKMAVSHDKPSSWKEKKSIVSAGGIPVQVCGDAGCFPRRATCGSWIKNELLMLWSEVQDLIFTNKNEGHFPTAMGHDTMDYNGI